MNSIRKWLYRPKKTDTSSLAQFYYADEELNLVAAELDSFDGRKDPERCTLLVNQLRACQDRVLTEIQKIMDEAISGQRANRDFRVKFPDDVLQESLAGQLWFGAECLAAGSSILNREVESASMRPLARALTKNLDSLRCILRDQSLRNCTEYTERIQEALVIFDKLFAEFELSYVSAMVPVKTMKEYDMLQEVTVLFSETVQRALQKDLLFQEMLDDYDPALMFAIPRLAIVCGLLIYPEGPLNPDMDPTSMSEMYRPFQTLLFKIRELLYTLSDSELSLLEKALCSSEEPDVSTPVLGQSDQLLQIDQGFDESAENVPLERIGSTIYVHSANSGSPVTPVNQNLSDYLPALHRGNFQFSGDRINLDENLPNLNKSESQDSGLQSENVSTSDTITVDAVPLTTHDTGGATSVVSPSGDEGCDRRGITLEHSSLRRDATQSVEELTSSLDDSKWISDSDDNNVCLKSCCSLESGGVSHMCREIIDNLVDDVVTYNSYGVSLDTKSNSGGSEITRQFSWQYNVQFAIPQISVSDQELHHDSNSVSSESTLSDPGQRDHFTDSVLDTLAHLSDAPDGEDVLSSRSEVQDTSSAAPKFSLVSDSSTDDLQETQTILNTCDTQSPPDYLSSTLKENSDLNNVQKDSNTSENVSVSTNNEVVVSVGTADEATASTSTNSEVMSSKRTNVEAGASTSRSNIVTASTSTAHVTTSTSTVNEVSASAGTNTEVNASSNSNNEVTASSRINKEVTELLESSLQSVSSQTNSQNGSVGRKRHRRRGSLERIHCKTGSQNAESGDITLEIPRIQRLRYTENMAAGRSVGGDCDCERGSCTCTGSETSSYNSECNDEEEIALAIQAAELASRNEARSRFRSSSDLIHRLFVCIAGVADQLQTNYASDLRHILKCVFEMNSNNLSPAEDDVMNGEVVRDTGEGQEVGQGHSEESSSQGRTRSDTQNRQTNGSISEPPKWVPDEESTGCTSCKTPFTFVRRRHHCRNCGKIFCGRCSANVVPLPQYGHQKPVRVCNKCFMFQVTHFIVDD